MKSKDGNTDEQFADGAINSISEAKQLLVDSAGTHTVLALSLADIYAGEAVRLKAKYGASDPRVADAKLKRNIARDNAKEIVSVLVDRKSPVKEPAADKPKEDPVVAARSAPTAAAIATATPTSTPTVKDPRTPAASSSKAPSSAKVSADHASTPGKGVKTKTRSVPAASTAKPAAPKVTASKSTSKPKQKPRTVK